MADEKIKKTKLEILQEKQKKLEEEIKKTKAEQQLILNKQKEKERKARTHRLIQIGAISEQYFGEFETPELYEKFLKRNKTFIKQFLKNNDVHLPNEEKKETPNK